MEEEHLLFQVFQKGKEAHDDKETKESQAELEDRLRKRFPAAWYIYDNTSQDFDLISKEAFLDKGSNLLEVLIDLRKAKPGPERGGFYLRIKERGSNKRVTGISYSSIISESTRP